RHEARVLVVGLDNSGKTTIVQHFKPQSVKPTFAYVMCVLTTSTNSRTCIELTRMYIRPQCWSRLPQLASRWKNSPRATSTSQSSTCRARVGTELCGSTITEMYRCVCYCRGGRRAL